MPGFRFHRSTLRTLQRGKPVLVAERKILFTARLRRAHQAAVLRLRQTIAGRRSATMFGRRGAVHDWVRQMVEIAKQIPVRHRRDRA